MLIQEWLEGRPGPLHFTLIDPDKQSPDELVNRVKVCQGYGTDAIMVGGSSPFSRQLLDDTVKAIKGSVDLPVILFPNSAAALTKYADYIFFMSLLNADDPRFINREQVSAVSFMEGEALRPLSMAYIVISTSRRPTAIERRVKLDRIEETDVEKASAYALAAQYLGMKCVYLEAGSGADRPVPPPMIREVKDRIDIPLIVGGGIRDADSARHTADAGADAIVTGTVVEEDMGELEAIIGAIRTEDSE